MFRLELEKKGHCRVTISTTVAVLLTVVSQSQINQLSFLKERLINFDRFPKKHRMNFAPLFEFESDGSTLSFARGVKSVKSREKERFEKEERCLI